MVKKQTRTWIGQEFGGHGIMNRFTPAKRFEDVILSSSSAFACPEPVLATVQFSKENGWRHTKVLVACWFVWRTWAARVAAPAVTNSRQVLLDDVS